MDRPELDPPLPLDMIAQFEAIESDPETAVSSGWFDITSVGQAQKTVLRMAELRAQLAADEEWADGERRRLNEQLKTLNDWVTNEQSAVEERCHVHEVRLEPWARARLEVKADGTKSFDLMGSKLRFVKAQDTYTIETSRFLAWAKEAKRPDLIRQADPQPDRNAVKKLMQLVDPKAAGGAVTALVDPATGETVAGVTVTIGVDEFSVVTPEVTG